MHKNKGLRHIDVTPYFVLENVGVAKVSIHLIHWHGIEITQVDQSRRQQGCIVF